MKGIIELERKTAELTDDIKDVLHASSINFKAIIVEAQQYPNSTLTQQFHYLEGLLSNLQGLVQKRPHLYMSYLITKQIQQQEERVRRERLTDYQEKIYDQRRIIAEKESFFESLLRPKKKRLPSQTPEEFQQMKAKEREAEERLKTELLFKELADLQALRRVIEDQERNGAFRCKKIQLQNTKTCSISNVNSTAVSSAEQGQFATQKIIPLQEKSNKQNIHGHTRTASLHQTITKQPLNTKTAQEQSIPQDHSNIIQLLDEISKFKIQNAQLHKIYDQQCLAIKFKKGQCRKLLGQYERVSRQLKVASQKLKQVKDEQKWRYQRCYMPVNIKRKTNSLEKSVY